jgi:hypothetical protein
MKINAYKCDLCEEATKRKYLMPFFIKDKRIIITEDDIEDLPQDKHICYECLNILYKFEKERRGEIEEEIIEKEEEYKVVCQLDKDTCDYCRSYHGYKMVGIEQLEIQMNNMKKHCISKSKCRCRVEGKEEKTEVIEAKVLTDEGLEDIRVPGKGK